MAVPTTIQTTSDGTITEWWRSGETQGAWAFVPWFHWDIVDIPGYGPFPVPGPATGYYATFIASAQGQIRDSTGGVTNRCQSVAMEAPLYLGGIGYSAVTCPYPDKPASVIAVTCPYPTSPLP